MHDRQLAQTPKSPELRFRPMILATPFPARSGRPSAQPQARSEADHISEADLSFKFGALSFRNSPFADGRKTIDEANFIREEQNTCANGIRPA